MNPIGDVEGRDCVIVDDMIDTGGTPCKAAEALKERGAKRVFAYATHVPDSLVLLQTTSAIQF